MLNLRLGILLGIRQIQRANPWSTILIILVIVFTFLNLIVASGILTGIVDGALAETREQAIGDVVMSELPNENVILRTEQILAELEKYPEIKAFSAHYTGVGVIEANFKERSLGEKADTITVTISGVDPDHERQTTGLDGLVEEGGYFEPGGGNQIIIGKYNLERYAEKFGGAFETLENVFPGDTVRLTVGSITEEYVVKGIIDSKIDVVALKVFIPEREFRRLFNRADHNANEILIRASPDSNEDAVKSALLRGGLGEFAQVKTFSEDTPKFISDVVETFDLVSLFIGFVGLAVASITIFIVIFINALSRKRQIGILKAIGITSRVIEYAYVVQAAFYTIIGSVVGVLITVYILVPYFNEHPIDFPYGDASLTVTNDGITIRLLAIFIITLIAGFVPAWLIARQNTLNSILGKK